MEAPYAYVYVPHRDLGKDDQGNTILDLDTMKRNVDRSFEADPWRDRERQRRTSSRLQMVWPVMPE